MASCSVIKSTPESVYYRHRRRKISPAYRNDNNPTGKGGFKPGEVHNPNGSFRKGQRVNATGRNQYILTHALKRVLRMKGPDGKRNDLGIAHALVEMCLGRDLDALQFIFERLEGKMPTVSQVSQQISGGESPLAIALDSYVQNSVLESDAVRELAHQMLAQIVSAPALPEGDKNG